VAGCQGAARRLACCCAAPRAMANEARASKDHADDRRCVCLCAWARGWLAATLRCCDASLMLACRGARLRYPATHQDRGTLYSRGGMAARSSSCVGCVWVVCTRATWRAVLDGWRCRQARPFPPERAWARYKSIKTWRQAILVGRALGRHVPAQACHHHKWRCQQHTLLPLAPPALQLLLHPLLPQLLPVMVVLRMEVPTQNAHLRLGAAPSTGSCPMPARCLHSPSPAFKPTAEMGEAEQNFPRAPFTRPLLPLCQSPLHNSHSPSI